MGPDWPHLTHSLPLTLHQPHFLRTSDVWIPRLKIEYYLKQMNKWQKKKKKKEEMALGISYVHFTEYKNFTFTCLMSILFMLPFLNKIGLLTLIELAVKIKYW